MGNSSSNIQQLIDALQALAYRWHAETWRSLKEQIAECLIAALQDKNYRLSKDLADLQALEVGPGSQDDPKIFANRFNQDLRFFLPLPGSASPDCQRFWKLQLLLHTVATSSRLPKLAKLLDLTELSIKAAMGKAASTKTASVGLWTPPQHVGYLVEAVKLLVAESPLELSTDGRHLTQGAAKAKLSPQHGQFMRLLLKHRPNPVPLRELSQVGINNPVQAKRRLRKQTAEQDIILNIAPSAGSYALLT